MGPNITCATDGGDAMYPDMVAVVMAMLIATLYMLPTLIAYGRDVPQRQMIVVINLVFGWTVAGWVVAMIMATNVVIHADGRY
jgi:membrane glycosyltransferase